MARNAKLSPGVQVFRGSRPRQDVFAKNAGIGCCDNSSPVGYDKLADRTRFDNSLAHSNPLGANDNFIVPFGDGFSDTKKAILDGINAEGVGFHISVLAIPTYAFVTGVGVHIAAEEPGLTFDLVTRNGLTLPSDCYHVVEAEVDDGCTVSRTDTYSDGEPLEGFGALGSSQFIDIFARSAGCGEFALEADEIALKVASMPASGIVTGSFGIIVSVSYEIIHRAAQ